MPHNVNSLRQFFENKQKELIQGDQRIKEGLAKSKSKGQRLSTDRLLAAGCNNSKNPILKSLWDAVKDYNGYWQHPTKMNLQQVYHSVGVLDFIYCTCATYMTEKSWKQFNSTNGPAKRQARYEAFTSLLREVANEVESLGGKMLTGPYDFRVKSANYWLERIDPHNRAGYEIFEKYNTWVKSHSPDTFWVWLTANGGEEIRLKTWVAGYANPSRAEWGLAYYIENGTFSNCYTDARLTTQTWRTEFSGQGWGIFVYSMPMPAPEGTIGRFLFSYNHRAGWSHHSSFLGGKPVTAAGEWIVRDGRVRVITAKSGHYKPTWQNLHTFVTLLPEIPGDAIIRPNMLDYRDNDGTIKYYRVSDFRSRKLAATPLKRNVVLSLISGCYANNDIVELQQMGTSYKLCDMLPT